MRRRPPEGGGVDAQHEVPDPRRQLRDGALRDVVHPDVFVAGDLAHPDAVLGKVMPMGCKSAGTAGAHVADNLARSLRGEREEPFDFAAPFYCVEPWMGPPNAPEHKVGLHYVAPGETQRFSVQVHVC